MSKVEGIAEYLNSRSPPAEMNHTAKKTASSLVFLVLLVTSTLRHSAQAQPTPVLGAKFSFDIHIDMDCGEEGWLVMDSAIPKDILQKYKSVCKYIEIEDIKLALDAMKPLMDWVEVNLPRESIDRATANFYMGHLHKSQGTLEKAIAYFLEAEYIFKKLPFIDPAQRTRDLFYPMLNLILLSETYGLAGRHQDGLVAARKALDGLVAARKALEEGTRDPIMTSLEKELYSMLANTIVAKRYVELGRGSDAIAVMANNSRIARSHIRDNPDILGGLGMFEMLLFGLYSSLGREQDAMAVAKTYGDLCKEMQKKQTPWINR
ncbi:MAG: hypothetical protein ACK587_05465 [Cyanobacteriota bacterium]